MKLVIDIPEYLYDAIMVDRFGTFSNEPCEVIRNGTPLPEGRGRLIDKDDLKKTFALLMWKEHNPYDAIKACDIVNRTLDFIDDAPIVEVPENTMNCILTNFGDCSYNKTGCSDCEVKNKIRKALEEQERPIGEWIIKPKENSQSAILICNKCKHFIPITIDANFCPNCGAKMKEAENG